MQARSALWLTLGFCLVPACKNESLPPAGDAAEVRADGGVDAGGRDAGGRGGGAGLPIGAPCRAGADCAMGQCLTEAEDPSFGGGYWTIKNCTDGSPDPRSQRQRLPRCGAGQRPLLPQPLRAGHVSRSLQVLRPRPHRHLVRPDRQSGLPVPLRQGMSLRVSFYSATTLPEA